MPREIFAQAANAGRLTSPVQMRKAAGLGVILLLGEEVIATAEVAELLGFAENAGSKNTFQQLPPDLRAFVEGLRAQGLNAPTDPSPININTPQGGFKVIAMRISASPNRWLIVLENAELEARLLEAERLAMIGTLAASVAHDIRNGFVAIKTCVDVLLEQQPAFPLAEVARTEMRRIDSILGRMLKLSSPARGEFRTVSLHELLEHTLLVVQRPFEQKCVALDHAFRAAKDHILGDPAQLQQVFLNLFLNALDATASEGRVVVETDLVEPGTLDGGSSIRVGVVRILIRDTGIGIAPGNLERVFEPFFTTKPNGTGLGLAIARKIVQEHSGTISVRSTLGEGATFDLSFPLAEGNAN